MIPPRVRAHGMEEESRDRFDRPLHDLRISVTDRCNFRCTYCMPKELFGASYRFMPRSELLSFEEIVRLAGIFVAHGVRKIRLTGGEPLLRQGIEDLVRMLSAVEGIEDLTLTTNGSLLTPDRARRLRAAGLERLTVSLDAVDDTVFSAMNDVGFPVEPVLRSIETAGQAGLRPIKINMVVKRGVNDHEIVPMAERFRGSGHIVRFIEYMDVGNTNGWRMDDIVPAREIVDRIGSVHPLRAVAPNYRGEVARRWRYADGAGEIGGHRLRHPAVLRRLHPRASLGGGEAVYVPVREHGVRPPPSRAQRHIRRSHLRCDRLPVEQARRSLLRAASWQYAAAATYRDVVHRRIAADRQWALKICSTKGTLYEIHIFQFFAT